MKYGPCLLLPTEVLEKSSLFFELFPFSDISSLFESAVGTDICSRSSTFMDFGHVEWLWLFRGCITFPEMVGILVVSFQYIYGSRSCRMALALARSDHFYNGRLDLYSWQVSCQIGNE